MGDLVDRAGKSEDDIDALDAFADSALEMPISEAAKKSGLLLVTAKRFVKSARGARILHEKRTARLRGDMANAAIRTLTDLMSEANPPAVRLNAAKFVLDLAGHSVDADKRERPMSEMTADELADFIAKADQQLHAKAEAAAKPAVGRVIEG